MKTETITWIDVATSLPDVERTVLVHAPRADEPVWLGYRDADETGTDYVWRWADGQVIEQLVTHWAELPAGPRKGKR